MLLRIFEYLIECSAIQEERNCRSSTLPWRVAREAWAWLRVVIIGDACRRGLVVHAPSRCNHPPQAPPRCWCHALVIQ